ncbi:hypothetical protein [Lacinutrix mariniflava]|uniref:hypothetical protein n=1 Tax=Lacinutrix mariniflava TaxID=342955 RepID=UPI00137916AB|nr:hypothetical protein [Lacinutrix mariniflava]
MMNNLMIPDNYRLEDVLKRLNKYAKKNSTRVTLIFDGLNETSYAHDGFSQLWINSLDSFVEALKSFPYLYLVATLRTSYIPRVWTDNNLPYSQIELNGFDGDKLNVLIHNYFTEYKINTDIVIESDKFYFKTPLFLDLYCQMLNGDKSNIVDPLLGLEGFTQVFDKYVSNLENKIFQKLNLPTIDQITDGIALVSQAMLNEVKAFVPKMEFLEKMQGKFIDNIVGSIGYEILQEYLIYLDENKDNRDVIVHTQQEVGGYLLAYKLIDDFGTVDAVVKSQFFLDFILGNSGSYHNLKDDILKFLIAKSDVSSLLYSDYMDLDVIKKFTLLNLQRSKPSDKNQELISLLKQTEFSVKEIRTLINDTSITFYDLKSNINFLFIRDVLLKHSSYDLDFTWTLHVYNNYYNFSEFLVHFINKPEELEGNENDTIILETAIWLSETTIRDLRDKSTRFLLQYFSSYPTLVLPTINKYSSTNRVYIQERLALVCYGVCLRLQNNEAFVKNNLNEIAPFLYDLQFSEKPVNPSYNYIVIDSYKHIIDLAILKGVFELDESNLKRLAEYEFVKTDWFEINQEDINAISNSISWQSSPNPDPLSGDFVHYTIPRLSRQNHEATSQHTAHIYKEIKRLGYITDADGLADREQSFYNGSSLLGSRIKVDRLGKKYSWIAYFNYAGYLLGHKELGIWSEKDSSYEKHFQRLSDTEIEPSYDVNITIDERIIKTDFFVNRTLEKGDWVNEANYEVLNNIYEREDYTLLSAFIDQKLDEKYKTRSWIEVKSFFVNKDQVLEHISGIENRDFDWDHDLHGGGSLSKVYFGELYWADTVPSLNKSTHSIPLEGTKEITREISSFEVRESGEFNFEDVGKEVTITVNDNCYFEYEQTLMDFLWESDSEQIPTLSCEIPSPNIGKYLKLTIDSAKTKILDSNLDLCFKEYLSKNDLNSENFHYFRTDLLQKYLSETNQLLMYQIKQHTYDQATDKHSEHFRGMQFVFSQLNRE